MIGFDPFPHCAMLAPMESFRAAFAFKIVELAAFQLALLSNPTGPPARCRAEVRFDACWPEGETFAGRGEMSRGAELSMARSQGEDGNKENGEQSSSESPMTGAVESERSAFLPVDLWCQEKYRSRSRSCLREREVAKPRRTDGSRFASRGAVVFAQCRREVKRGGFLRTRASKVLRRMDNENKDNDGTRDVHGGMAL